MSTNMETHAAHTEAGNMNHNMQQCIEECFNCHSVCLATAQHCLQMGGKHASPEHIRTLLDCALSCQTSANFMLHNSPFHARYCGLCAEVCAACAQSCEQMSDGDAQMQACAAACRRCEESCRRMASTM